MLSAVPPQKTITELNLSCPGESSGSFLNTSVPDYGCNDHGPQGQPPFKGSIGLHTTYSPNPLEAQMTFALTELQSNKNIDLVTLNIGANDFLLLIASCTDSTGTLNQSCLFAGMPGTAAKMSANLNQILSNIRYTAGYSGKLVILLQYSPTSQLIPVAATINATLLLTAAPYGVTFADGFTAYELASLPYGGDPCKAGLLVAIPGAGCDIHPSLAGQTLLAKTILASIGGKL